MVGLDIEEAKKFIKEKEIDSERLEELVGKTVRADAMFTIYFVDNVLDTARYDVCKMEANSVTKEEIYKKLDFYHELLKLVKNQMCICKYTKDRQDDVGTGITKLKALMEKYTQKPEQTKPASAQDMQSASYTQQTFPFKGNAAQSSGSKAPSHPSGSKVWSTKDKNNIDRILDNFNKRQKK